MRRHYLRVLMVLAAAIVVENALSKATLMDQEEHGSSQTSESIFSSRVHNGLTAGKTAPQTRARRHQQMSFEIRVVLPLESRATKHNRGNKRVGAWRSEKRKGTRKNLHRHHLHYRRQRKKNGGDEKSRGMKHRNKNKHINHPHYLVSKIAKWARQSKYVKARGKTHRNKNRDGYYQHVSRKNRGWNRKKTVTWKQKQQNRKHHHYLVRQLNSKLLRNVRRKGSRSRGKGRRGKHWNHYHEIVKRNRKMKRARHGKGQNKTNPKKWFRLVVVNKRRFGGKMIRPDDPRYSVLRFKLEKQGRENSERNKHRNNQRPA